MPFIFPLFPTFTVGFPGRLDGIIPTHQSEIIYTVIPMFFGIPEKSPEYFLYVLVG
jgi:hypothetical protein